MFYPGEYLRDTQCLSESAQVAYDRIMCEHMRNICISQQQLNFFTKRLSDEDLESLLHVLIKTEVGYCIEWVYKSISKRISYSESRSKNRARKNKFHMKTYDGVMVDEDIDVIITQIIERLNIQVPENEKNFTTMLVAKMVAAYLKHNPEYFFHQESDYAACLQIAYHIAKMKKWTKHDVINGKMNDCLSSWETIINYINKDQWFSGRSLTDISTVKEWQRLTQQMSKTTTNGTTKIRNSNSTDGKEAPTDSLYD